MARKMQNSGRDGVIKNIAMGATGLALTAGAVAVGATLANKRNRERFTHTVSKGIEYAKKATEEPRQRMAATAHQITSKKGDGLKKMDSMMGKGKRGKKAKK